LIREGKVKSARVSRFPIQLALSDEQGFPHEGFINFVDNQVDPGTGTLRLRGEFANPDHILSPGLFVRIRLEIGSPHPALLVSERALGTEQDMKYVYVVNEKSEAIYRSVQIGLAVDGLRVIEKGLKPGEKVIISGLQRVRREKPVKVIQEVPMPAGPAATAPILNLGTGRETTSGQGIPGK
jgi:RND family efflux transporter MFP subunit